MDIGLNKQGNRQLNSHGVLGVYTHTRLPCMYSPTIGCDALQHTATHCNTLQHTATHLPCIYSPTIGSIALRMQPYDIGWLRLVGVAPISRLLILEVSLAKEPYKKDYIPQKRLII